MPTKEELVAFGQSAGLDVDSSMLKPDIEAALTDAGYDPTTLEGDMGTEESAEETAVAEDLAGTSSDAQFSTYNEASSAKDVNEGANPPPGRSVEQTRGEPSEGGGTVFSANR